MPAIFGNREPGGHPPAEEPYRSVQTELARRLNLVIPAQQRKSHDDLMRSPTEIATSSRHATAMIFCSRGLRCLCAALAVSVASARSLLSMRGGAVSLDSDDAKSLYALGCNVGRQVGDLDCFSPDEIDNILLGVKDTLTRKESQVELMEYLPKVAKLFKERQEAHHKHIEAAGKAALAAAAEEEGAVTTESGLVYKSLQEGEGESPSADSTVRVHYTGSLPDGTFADADAELTFDSSLKRGEPYDSWQAVTIAKMCGMRVGHCAPFKPQLYPGYAHRRSVGDTHAGDAETARATSGAFS